jgi:uncharacterized protein
MKKDPVVHFEMAYKDGKRAAEFYEKAFGWKMNLMGEEMGKYLLAETTETDENHMVKTPGEINGGLYDISQADSSGQTVHIVISVDNLEESLKKAEEAGAKVVRKPMDIPGIGMYASILDTEGNNVGVLQPSRP